MPNICIIGLGNPGTKYDGTRHNVGKDWIKSIATDRDLTLHSKKKIESTTAISSDEKILWGYPNRYVNESGYSINKILKNNNFKLEQVIVIHDDLDLPIGSLKLKIGGGHGGHNGLRSIISHVGKSFIRLRVSANSSFVSPGKPTIISVEIPTFGNISLIILTRSIKCSLV